MKMQIITKQIPSSDGIHTLNERIYLPSCKPVGFLQTVHGMAEHIERYDALMRFMAENGFICFGHDHLGHGRTVKDETELGYFAPRKGYDFLLKDIQKASQEVISEYSDKDSETSLPYCLLGHSMGSFIVRLAAEQYVHPDKLIIMGTSGKNPAAVPGIAFASVIQTFCGKKHISPLLNKVAFGSFNKKFEDSEKNDGFLWLSTDKEERDMYIADRFCGFDFTVSAIKDLIKMIKYSNRRGWFKTIASRTDILLVSGSDDPVGNYGKGVKEVYDRLKKENADVKMIIYDGARHEIMHDFCREKVFEDIKNFIMP